MTIVYQSSRAAALATLGYENNPFVFFDNLASAYDATTGVETGGPVANLASDATNKFCLPTVNGSGYAELEFEVSDGVSIFALASHNIGTIGATVRMQYESGGIWVDSGAGPVTPDDDQAIIWRIDESSETTWRLLVEDAAGTQPAIGILWAGAETIIPTRVYQGYAPPIRPNMVRTTSNVSEGGHYLGSSTARMGSTSSVSFNHIPATFARGAEFAAFADRFNAGGTFFFAWRPTKYGDAHYAWKAGDTIQPQNSGPLDYMSFGMAMRFHHDP